MNYFIFKNKNKGRTEPSRSIYTLYIRHYVTKIWNVKKRIMHNYYYSLYEVLKKNVVSYNIINISYYYY